MQLSAPALTNNVICCYDGDRAGRARRLRALEMALPYMTDGRQLRFMFLPMAKTLTRWYERR
ncbi:hypothetical protein ACVXHA_06370 [Escherichia coli]